MPDLHGQCQNLDCSAGLSQRTITLPAGARFVCPICKEPLQPVLARSARGFSGAALALCVAAAFGAGAGTVYGAMGGRASDLERHLAAVGTRLSAAVYGPRPVSTLPPILPARVPEPPAAAPELDRLRAALREALEAQRAREGGAGREAGLRRK